MTENLYSRRNFSLLGGSFLALSTAACQTSAPPAQPASAASAPTPPTSGLRLGEDAVAGQRPSGTVTMHQVQAAYIASGGGGEGVLTFRRRRYPFRVGSAGVGGIGASTLDARGDVYNLRDISQFAGTYAQTRRGIAVGSASRGDMWLQNEAGVIMHLRARRTGLMLSMGADAVVISMR